MNVRSAGLFVILWLTGALLAQADGFRLESVGSRFGTSKIGDDSQFYLLEGFANWNAPWRWDYQSGWSIQTRLEVTAGWINGRGDDAFMASIGPAFEVGRNRLPVVMELGVSPTILTRDEFGHTDLGIPFQFCSHAGLIWKTGDHLRFEARIQHISNAAIGSSNPGVNLYMFGVGWRF